MAFLPPTIRVMLPCHHRLEPFVERFSAVNTDAHCRQVWTSCFENPEMIMRQCCAECLLTRKRMQETHFRCINVYFHHDYGASLVHTILTSLVHPII